MRSIMYCAAATSAVGVTAGVTAKKQQVHDLKSARFADENEVDHLDEDDALFDKPPPANMT